MESMLADLRYSMRQFRRVPLLVAAIVGTLALAVGANTLLFAIANAALFRALPYPDASQVVSFSLAPKGRDVGRIDEPTMRVAAERGVAALEAVSFYDTTSATIAGGEYPERFAGGRVSEAFFDVLRTRPALGRTFTASELRTGGPAVIVLGDGLWTRRFGRNAAIVGQRIQLDDRSYEVVGVMPPGFSYPGSAEFWVPYISRRLPPGSTLFVDAIGRLRPSASIEQARSALAALGQSVTAEMKNTFVAGYELRVVPLQERLYGDFTRPLVMLLATVACVVLIGCANIANLLLARSSARRTELAIRGAIGASASRLFRQLLAENLLLAGAGAMAGLALAYAGLRLFRAFGPPALVRLPSLAIDGQVLLFTLALTIVTGLLFGLAPALSAARVDPGDSLKGARGASADRGRPRRALVALEIAAAVVLLLGAALLTRSFLKYQDVDRGFRGYNVLTASITLSPARYADAASRRVFFERLTAHLRALPDVESVTVTRAVLSGMIMTIPWKPGTGPDGQVPEIVVGGSGDGHYRTFGIPMLDGRECAGAADGSAVVINRSMARLAFGERSAIGRSIDLSAFGMGTPNVLGVSEDVRNVETKAPPRPTVYECSGGEPGASSVVALRVREGTPALALTPALRSAVRGLDPTQPLTRVRTVEQIVREGMSARWFDALVLAALAGLALVLALGGLYAVTAYAVQQRTREIGVRLALGADRGAVMRLVLRQGGVIVAIGVGLGLAAGLPLVRFVRAMLFDVQPLDPAVFALVAAAVVITALVATFIPAWRASRVDPMIALRAE